MLNPAPRNGQILKWIRDTSGISLLYPAQSNLAIEEFSGTTDVALKDLFSFLKHHKLQKLKTELILTPENYRLVLLDAPPVPPEEYKLAARWLIKDFIDYPPEQAVIDVFPITVKPGEAAKIYVVVSPLAELTHLVNSIKKADLVLEKINITELAFAAAMPAVLSSQALLYSIGKRLRLLIIENKDMRWFRDLDLEWTGETLAASQLDVLSFEIQRSLDYYQTEVNATPPSQLKLAPLLYEQTALRDTLIRVISVEIVPLINRTAPNLRQLLANYLLVAGAEYATN